MTSYDHNLWPMLQNLKYLTHAQLLHIVTVYVQQLLIYNYMCVHVHMQCMCMNMRACMRACVCVSICACVCACVCVCWKLLRDSYVSSGL